MSNEYSATANLTKTQKKRLVQASKIMGLTESEIIKRALHYLLVDFPIETDDLVKRDGHGWV